MAVSCEVSKAREELMLSDESSDEPLFSGSVSYSTEYSDKLKASASEVEVLPYHFEPCSGTCCC